MIKTTTSLTLVPPVPVPVPVPETGGDAPVSGAFALVGIGASAGGLQPISEVLASAPPDSGFAYVVVQHLDADHAGLLPEVLRGVTPMPVIEVDRALTVRADHVYVIAPDSELSLEQGRLVPRPAAGVRAQRRPIDDFFRALARHSRQHAVAILLSGMGADGAHGLAAVREAGGLALAQLPSSAEFEAMPASAIAAEVVDLVALPAQMMEHIGRWWRMEGMARLPVERERESLRQLFELLLRQTGADFSNYKLSTVLRRVDRRMRLRQSATLDDYLAFLRANLGELDLLFKELLIGVTHFFRDPGVWDQLRDAVFPELLLAHPEGGEFKAWVPACSTGEEAYTLAIVFREAALRMPAPERYSLQIFATDLDLDAIGRARQGIFGADIGAQVPADVLRRYFIATDEGGYRIAKDIRKDIIFAKQNVISDPPFTKLDVLCCRNLLIYFTPKLQAQLIPLFHYSLRPNGLLVLGSADTPGQFNDMFAAVTPSSRVFRRLDAPPQRVVSYFVTRTPHSQLPMSQNPNAAARPSLQQQIEQHLLLKHTPAAVLVNADGDILYIHGRTGAFLEPAAGKANWNIHAMVRDHLRHALASLLQQAGANVGPVALRGLALTEAGGPVQMLDLSAEALTGGELAGTVLLTFALAAGAPAKRRSRSGNPQVQELERQLAQARLEIQAVRDEMQGSREELRSANEELQSTNEELQSTNEELTTSKEEMQSLNEELYTVNAELQSKVDDLSTVNGDMKNLLNSTDIATIFLDGEMRIRRFTERATQIFKLIAADLHRPLSDINNELDYPELEQDSREVLRTLVFCERQIPTRNGRWFSVRIMPYRTVENVIDGVVLTFVNVTEFKQLEARLRAVQSGEGDAGPAPR
ncbi:PAS domain-containing protein [Duganella sp. FT94W]|uniref:protein-glutamate O-methyltransferase n=1 Tax=Duganella lactea TaxID=2692173 RepID=A0ABW9V9M9_9BURK|nr:CheR family methyltransferase [Duganella lactea]MYM36326.1 PAS domain-containing protein [Duganella lactea]